jgi:hypothetical protein
MGGSGTADAGASQQLGSLVRRLHADRYQSPIEQYCRQGMQAESLECLSTLGTVVLEHSESEVVFFAHGTPQSLSLAAGR